MTADNIKNARHVIGIDLGTSAVRVHLVNFDDSGRPIGAPSAVLFSGTDPNGSLLTIIEIDATGRLLLAGRPARIKAARGDSVRFVTEFKASIAQNAADMNALGRPATAHFCPNGECREPGKEWPLSIQYCGSCGTALTQFGSSLQYKNQFPYSPQEALSYSGQLLSYIARHLETQYEALTAGTGWAVVCGVPAYWQADTLAAFEATVRTAFPRAALCLDVEPLSALRYSCMDGSLLELHGDEARSAHVLIIDSGASITSLVLARVEVGPQLPRLTVVSTYTERFGGSDFDTALAEFAASKVGVNLDAAMLPYWKLLAREWKEAFNSIPEEPGHASLESASMSFPIGTANQRSETRSVSLNREIFEIETSELAKRFTGILGRGVESFNIEPNTINHVLVVGGGAHYGFIQPAVHELLKHAQIIGVSEPEKSASRGLAFAAAREGLRGTGHLTVASFNSFLEKPEPEPASQPPGATGINRVQVPPEDVPVSDDGKAESSQTSVPDPPMWVTAPPPALDPEVSSTGSTISVNAQPAITVVPKQVAQPLPITPQRSYKSLLLSLAAVAIIVVAAIVINSLKPSAGGGIHNGTTTGGTPPVAQSGTLKWPKIAAPEKDYPPSKFPEVYEKLYSLPDDAKAQAESILAADPKSPLALAVKAYGLLRLDAVGNKVEATTDANEAISLANGEKLAQSVALTDLAWIFELDNPDKQEAVVEAYTKATDAYHTVISYTAEANYYLSKVSSQDEVDLVSGLFNKAMESAATKREAAYVLYKYYGLLVDGNRDKSLADYEKVQALKTDSGIEDLFNLGS